MKVRFTEGQVLALRRMAARRGVSMAAIVREALDRTVADKEEGRRRERASLGER